MITLLRRTIQGSTHTTSTNPSHHAVASLSPGAVTNGVTFFTSKGDDFFH